MKLRVSSLLALGLIGALNVSDLHAMKRALEEQKEEEIYKPTIRVKNPETGEGYLSEMPAEIKVHIAMVLYTAKDLPEAVQAIRALAITNKELSALMNDVKITKGLVHMLVEKFGSFHEWVAKELATPGAKEYIVQNTVFTQNNVLTAKSVKELEQRLGFDISYIDRQGKGIIFIALEKWWPIQTIQYLIDKAPLYIPDVPSAGTPEQQHEWKLFIIDTIAQGNTLQDVVLAIQNKEATNPEFKIFINNPAVTRKIINILAAKFGMYTKAVAQKLDTNGAQAYVVSNEKFNQRLYDTIRAYHRKKKIKPVTVADIKMLVESEKMDPRYSDENGDYTFFQGWNYLSSENENATRDNRIKILKYLMEHGTDINMIDSDGNTILVYVLSNNERNSFYYSQDMALITFILSNIDPTLIDQCDQHGRTALKSMINYYAGINCSIENSFVFPEQYEVSVAFFHLLELFINTSANVPLKDNSTSSSLIAYLYKELSFVAASPDIYRMEPGLYNIINRVMRFIMQPTQRVMIQKMLTMFSHTKTLPEAIAAIQAQVEICLCLNDFLSMQDVIQSIRSKFGSNDETIAHMLKIPGVQKYVEFNKAFMLKCMQGITMEEVQQFIEAGGDLKFRDSNDNTCLNYLAWAASGKYNSVNLVRIAKKIAYWQDEDHAKKVLSEAEAVQNHAVVKGITEALREHASRGN